MTEDACKQTGSGGQVCISAISAKPRLSQDRFSPSWLHFRSAWLQASGLNGDLQRKRFLVDLIKCDLIISGGRRASSCAHSVPRHLLRIFRSSIRQTKSRQWGCACGYRRRGPRGHRAADQHQPATERAAPTSHGKKRTTTPFTSDDQKKRRDNLLRQCVLVARRVSAAPGVSAVGPVLPMTARLHCDGVQANAVSNARAFFMSGVSDPSANHA